MPVKTTRVTKATIEKITEWDARIRRNNGYPGAITITLPFEPLTTENLRKIEKAVGIAVETKKNGNENQRIAGFGMPLTDDCCKLIEYSPYLLEDRILASLSYNGKPVSEFAVAKCLITLMQNGTGHDGQIYLNLFKNIRELAARNNKADILVAALPARYGIKSEEIGATVVTDAGMFQIVVCGLRN